MWSRFFCFVRMFPRRALGIVGIVVLASAIIAIKRDHDVFYKPAPFHVSCADVGVGKPLWLDPRSDSVSSQFERRGMIEKRIFDCSWRAYRSLLSASRNNTPYSKIFADMAREISKISEPMRNYMNITAAVLQRDALNDYYIHQSADVWGYSNSILHRAGLILAENPAILEAGIDPDILSFLGVTVERGKVFLDSIPMPIISTQEEQATKEGRQWLGLIGNRMKFSPLTVEQISFLDEIQLLHTKWARAVLKNYSSDEVQSLVDIHHGKHHALIHSARTADEQSLFTLAEHSPHDICGQHTLQELDLLLGEADQRHHEWVGAVKDRNFERAWIASLLHARAHTLLATCDLTLPELTR